MSEFVFLLVVYLSNGTADVSKVSYPTIEACAVKVARVMHSMTDKWTATNAVGAQCLPMPKSVSEPMVTCEDYGWPYTQTCGCTTGIPPVCSCEPCQNERTDPPEYPLASVPVPDVPAPRTEAEVP